MFDSRKYRPEDEALIDAFVGSQRQATLIATAPGESPQASILPYIQLADGSFELHIVQADATFDAIQRNPKVSLLVSDYLAYSPHHWVDPKDGSQSTLHFQAVLIQGEARVTTEPADVAAALGRLVGAFGHATEMAPVVDGELYGPQLRRLAAVRIAVESRQAKFKLGSGDRARRMSIVQGLRERCEPNDARAADVIERYANIVTPA